MKDVVLRRVHEITVLAAEGAGRHGDWTEADDARIELEIFLEERADLYGAFGAAIVAQERREEALELLDDVLLTASDSAVADVLESVDRLDVGVACHLLRTEEYRWADRVLRHPTRFARLTAKYLHLSTGWGDWAGDDYDSGDWRNEFVTRTWAAAPFDAWTVWGHVGINLGDETIKGGSFQGHTGGEDLWCYIFDRAPFDVFSESGPKQPSHELLTLADAHAAAFLFTIDRLGGLTNEAVRTWIHVHVTYSVPGCGDTRCCRAGLWEAALLRRGFNVRVPLA